MTNSVDLKDHTPYTQLTKINFSGVLVNLILNYALLYERASFITLHLFILATGFIL